MKSFKKPAAIFLAVVFALSVTACSSKANSQMALAGDRGEAMSSAAPAAAPEAMYEDAMAQEAGNGGNELANRSDTSTAITDTSRKLIRRVYLNVETKAFDELSAQITKRIGELGGYFENSEIGGQSGKGGPQPVRAGETRYAHMVIRIPKNNVDVFVGMVSENSNVTAKTESAEDVTLAYVDVESRKKALTVEQDRLLMLLGKSERIEDIIKLEERLSDVRYQLESYGSQLRLYDNQVDYSTVSLDVYEVQRETPAEPTTMLSRIKTGFGQTIYDMSMGLQNFTVWFVVNLPYLLIWAAIIFAIVFVVRKQIKKHKNSPQEQLIRQVMQPMPQAVQAAPPAAPTAENREAKK